MDKLKPTRLWHLTGKKHFARLIKDRECAFPQSPRGERDVLQLVAITIASALAIAGTFGKLSPPKRSTEVRKCDTSKSKKPSCKPPKEPCPPKEDEPMKSCTSKE